MARRILFASLRLRKDGVDTIYAGEKDERLSDTPRKIVFGGLVSGLKWRKESNFFFGEGDNFLVCSVGYLSQDVFIIFMKTI